MKIEVIKNKILLNNDLWGKLKKYDLGQQILNLLFYMNRDGLTDFTLIVNGLDETQNFKDAVKSEYSNIPNTSLRDNFFKYANITI